MTGTAPHSTDEEETPAAPANPVSRQRHLAIRVEELDIESGEDVERLDDAFDGTKA